MSTPTKEKLLQTLTTFVRQKPGFDPANYADVASYRADVRSVTKDLHAFNELASFCALHDVKLLETKHYDRLHWDPVLKEWDYTAGQYWCTEYRAAACNLLAGAIWHYFRDECHCGDSIEIKTAARRNFSARTVKRFF